jgi:hypothetical protein
MTFVGIMRTFKRIAYEDDALAIQDASSEGDITFTVAKNGVVRVTKGQLEVRS